MENLFDTTEFTYDPRAGRYRFRDSGQFVNGNQFRYLTNQLIKANTQKIERITRQRFQSLTGHPEWRKEVLTTLRETSVQSFVLHRGGASRVTTEDMRLLTDHNQRQFRYFRDLSSRIEKGNITQDEAIRRIKLYARNASVVETIAHQQNFGEGFGYRVRNNAESCPDCLRQAAQGVRPISQLVSPGTQCVCGRHCDCQTLLFNSLEDAIKSKQKGSRKGSLVVSVGRLPKKV